MEATATIKEHLLPNERVHLPELTVFSVLLLMTTIFLEIIGTLMLKHSVVDARAYVPAFLSYFFSLYTFSRVLHYVPLTIAYTTWCTVGTVGVCVLSNFFFDESMKPLKWLCVILTIPCIIGLYVL